MTKRTLLLSDEVYELAQFAYQEQRSGLLFEDWLLTQLDRAAQMPEVDDKPKKDYSKVAVAVPVLRQTVTIETEAPKYLELSNFKIEKLLKRFWNELYTTENFERHAISWVDRLYLVITRRIRKKPEPLDVYGNARRAELAYDISKSVISIVWLLLIAAGLLSTFKMPIDLTAAHSLKTWSGTILSKGVAIGIWVLVLMLVKRGMPRYQKMVGAVISSLGSIVFGSTVLLCFVIGLGDPTKVMHLQYAASVNYWVSAVTLAAAVIVLATACALILYRCANHSWSIKRPEESFTYYTRKD